MCWAIKTSEIFIHTLGHTLQNEMAQRNFPQTSSLATLRKLQTPKTVGFGLCMGMIVPLCGVYGDLIDMYPKPYSILRGTIVV